jgi:hypothetical protein
VTTALMDRMGPGARVGLGTRIGRVVATVATVAAAGLLASGCGGDDDPTATPAERPEGLPVSCDLLTDTEVESLVGPGEAGSMRDNRPDEAVAYSFCQWSRADGSLLLVTFVDGPDRYEGRQQLAADGTIPDTSQVDDLGDGALLAQKAQGSSPGGWVVTVLAGDDTLEVLLERPDEVGSEEVIDTARTVLQRL